MDYDIARLTELIPRLKSGELRVEMCEPQSQEWLDARFDGIGGSEVAALIGCGYGDNTPYKLWKEKRERIVTESNYAMDRGTAMEEPIAKWYAKENGVDVLRVPMLVDVARPWRRVNLDRIAIEQWGQNRVYALEIKYSVFAPFSELPVWYYSQVIYQMAMTGLTTPAHLAFSGPHMHGTDYLPVEFDAELAETMLQAVDAFWRDHVLADVPPPPSSPDEFMLDAVKKSITGNKIDAPAEAEPLALRLMELNETCKSIEAEQAEIKGRLAEMMAQSKACKITGADKGWVMYTVSAKGNVNYKRIVDDKLASMTDKEKDAYRGHQKEFVVFKGKKEI